jgi:2-keto-3-deoxy-L-rhamnonate aldolase RhmA
MSFKQAFANPLKEKLRKGKSTFGIWVTMHDASISEIASAMGLDWVVLDLEHSSLSLKDVVAHIRAAKGSQTSVLVRVPTDGLETIKRVLDLGAHGILVPNVRSAEEISEVVSLCKYPPLGTRGIGGDRTIGWGLGVDSYLDHADEQVMVVPVVETREAVENIDSILDVQGIEALFFGPADLSSNYGFRGQWFGGDTEKMIVDIAKQASDKGIGSGLIARNAVEAKQKLSEGFQMIGLGSDAGLVVGGVATKLGEITGKKPEKLGFS